MARLAHRLTVVALRGLPPGKHADGIGLYLLKSSSETGRWMLRYRQFGRRRDMGLGGWPAVGLAEARRSAIAAREQLRSDQDPISVRRQKRQSQLKLLRDVAKDCFEARKGELRGEGRDGRWFSPLELHVLPKLGSLPVTEIEQIAIRDTLAPLWREKPVTAEKALKRLGIVLRHAAALGLEVDLQATLKAKLLLGRAPQSAEIPSQQGVEISCGHAPIRLRGERLRTLRERALL